MAFRSYVKPMLTRLIGRSSTYATSTSPKMKAYAPTANPVHFQDINPRAVKGEFVPVYVAVGMILLSTTLGLYTGLHHLSRAPDVSVRKSRRETLPELEDPDHVVEETDQFIKKSFFRKVAHVQELDQSLPNPIRGDVLATPPRTETLKSVGVDPKIH